MKLKSILLLSSALLTVTQSFSQSFVSTGTKKYSLIEEATGNWCGYCPDGAQVIEQLIQPNYSRAIIASWHGYTGTGDAMILGNDPFTSLSGYITGFPDGTVNRSGSWSGGIGQDRSGWASDLQSDSSTSPNFEVMMGSYYKSSDSTIYITLVAKALVTLTGTWGVNVLIKEDSIPSTNSGYQQHSYYDSVPGPSTGDGMTSWYIGECASPCPSYSCGVCAVLPAADYWHNNVVRAVLAKHNEVAASPAPTSDSVNIYGDSAFTNPKGGAIYVQTYTYHIPTTSNPHFISVIGMVQNMDPTTAGPLLSGMPKYYGNRVIENSIESRVSKMSGTTTIENDSLHFLGVTNTSAAVLENVSIFPNPAANSISVAFDLAAPSETKITITNILGESVITKQYPANGTFFSEKMPLNNLPNGVYIMKIVANGGQTTKQFTVVK